MLLSGYLACIIYWTVLLLFLYRTFTKFLIILLLIDYCENSQKSTTAIIIDVHYSSVFLVSVISWELLLLGVRFHEKKSVEDWVCKLWNTTLWGSTVHACQTLFTVLLLLQMQQQMYTLHVHIITAAYSRPPSPNLNEYNDSKAIKRSGIGYTENIQVIQTLMLQSQFNDKLEKYQ